MNRSERIAREVCARKAARGNYFTEHEQAARKAATLAARTGEQVRWYRCWCCRGYHLGRRR